MQYHAVVTVTGTVEAVKAIKGFVPAVIVTLGVSHINHIQIQQTASSVP